MDKRILIISCYAAIVAAGACSMGTAQPPNARASGGRTGSDAAPSKTGGNAGTNTAGASSIAVSGAGNEAVPCGTFTVGTSSTYNTATLRGQASPNSNSESTIELYGVAAGAPICAKGTVISPAQGWGWAMVNITLDAVIGTVIDEIAGAGQPTQTQNSIVSQTDGLFVKINNKAQTDLRICVQGTNFDQWCTTYVDNGKLIAWNSLIEQTGGKVYAKQPLLSIQVTVPDQGGSGAFDFCVESIVEGAGWCGCPGGTCACPADNDACAGTCVPDMTANPNNCGACGSACPSTSACSAGQCIGSLYPDLITPNTIAIDGASIYFTESETGNVKKVSLTSGTPEIIASGQNTPTRIVVSAGNVYWVNAGSQANNYTDGSILTLANGVPTQLASAQDNATSIAVDANFIYWVNAGTPSKGYADGAILKLDLAAAAAAGAPVTPVVLASDRVHPRAIALDTANVYWVEQGSSGWGTYRSDGQVVKLAFDQTTPETLVPNLSSPMGIAVDANDVYFSTTEGVSKLSLADRTTTTLATGQSWPQWLVVDATNLYWTNSYDGSLMRAPTAGGTQPVVLARGKHYARNLVVDSTDIYWVTQDIPGAGGILKLPK